MVYEWEDKQADCYRLYVVERKSLDEVMNHFKSQGFNPSKRAFQTQFKRWDFPSKQNPAHKNELLVARVKELWEGNATQKDMVEVLEAEGFDIKPRELMRLRQKYQLLLRAPNGMRDGPRASETTTPDDIDESQDFDALLPGFSQVAPTPDVHSSTASTTHQNRTASSSPPTEFQDEVSRKRQQRRDELVAESEKRWATRKRRRRTRGYAGLPPDPPGPPRFPSETTLDEAKVYLQLDNVRYKELRDQFQAICQEQGVIKKTLAGPDKWNEVKSELIRQSQHLQQALSPDPTQPELINYKRVSLDVICTDVTKRIRTIQSKMTLADAKNVLGLNPEETRQLRTAFYAVLEAAGFTSKTEAGQEHWDQLQKQWISEHETLQRILAPGDIDPEHHNKRKAVDLICRDVIKRLRDDLGKQDPSRKKPTNNGPGPGPAPPSSRAVRTPRTSLPASMTVLQPEAQMVPYAVDVGTFQQGGNEFQIDPSLLLAANETSGADASGQGQPAVDTQRVERAPTPIPVYFRIAADSPYSAEPLVWLDALMPPATMEALAHSCAQRHPGTQLHRIQGLVGTGVGSVFHIRQHDELQAYLAHVAGSQATFLVSLVAHVNGDGSLVDGLGHHQF